MSDDEYIDDANFYDDDEYLEPSKSKKKRVRREVDPKFKKKAKVVSDSTLQLDDEEYDGFQDLSKVLTMKKDHDLRPLWVAEDCRIFLESFSPLYQQANDFLIAISEPESRPEFIRIFRLTKDSLYAAAALGMETETIIKVLDRLCKTQVPLKVIEFVKESTATFGKAKLVLRDNNYYLESPFQHILHELLKNPIIANSRADLGNQFILSSVPLENKQDLKTQLHLDSIEHEDDLDEIDYDTLQNYQTYSFQIKQTHVPAVKKSSKDDSKYPLMEEYDFKKDKKNPNLSMNLKPSTKIRPYQEKALSKMFGNGRARSGIIVLPCGAGKSLTGVTAASTIKKSCVVMCINNASVIQWKEQFRQWTDVSESSIKIFTSADKNPLPPSTDACIVISTYSMLCHSGKRSESGQHMIDSIKSREWGLIILDEVHVAPADMFQTVVQHVNAHCKLGLTATLVREDNKIQDLGYLVGPKMYEANWMDLTSQGFLASVDCLEIWCPMTKEFYAEYIKSVPRLQRLLYTVNPNKFRACEHLVRIHKERGDKIIIFSDDVPALKLYCEELTKKEVCAVPFIYGEVDDRSRRDILTAFKTNPKIHCLGLSKVGDTALDIPEANVIIQVSSHFGARRQEAQRLGRILRPKPNPSGGNRAFFYTLISTDTKEMYFSSKRQQYLIDQGYSFKVDQMLVEDANRHSICLATKNDEIKFLTRACSLQYSDDDAKEDRAVKKLAEGEYEDGNEEPSRGGGVIKRKVTNISSLTEGGNVLYTER